ncbi:unannotated protein [freshwater metagenome]|uniref:Unannotated protein n=1 Tax=freshwater metagenome TaxID=449393 RepID=A0A6J7PH60_9ZZZZ|nr:SCO1664 family protein [Actinomycetota bacterium]
MAIDGNGSLIASVLVAGQLTVTGRLVDASNATLYAKTTVDEIELACIYKPIAGEKPLWDFADGTLADREYAAYLVSNRTGLDVVPITILRDGPFGPGMVQQWIDIDDSVDLVSVFKNDLPQLRKMALFDAIINNTDRKIGHLLPTTDGDIFGCDHGVTFHADDKLRTVLWQWADIAFDSKELHLLNTFVQDLSNDLGELLQKHLTAAEIAALTARTQKLIANGRFPLPSKDWPAVPWPAY